MLSRKRLLVQIAKCKVYTVKTSALFISLYNLLYAPLVQNRLTLVTPIKKLVSLTETKAYQQMMQSSQRSAKLKDLDGLGDSEEESSDDEKDDEIEEATSQD